MKVLLIAYVCAPDKGSEYAFGWNWPLHLIELGHEVYVLNPMGPRKKKALASLSIPNLPNLHFIDVQLPTWFKFLRRYVKYVPVLNYLVWQKQAYDIALQLDEKHRFDVVHHVTMANLSAGSLLWKLNKPFIFGPVGGGQVAPPAFKKYFLNGWASEASRSLFIKHLEQFNPLLKITVKQADLVLATNCDTVNLARKSGARRVELFVDGGLCQDYLPHEAFTKSTSQELRLLWVAQIVPRKGLLLTLEALSKVSYSIPFKLIILGRGELSRYIPQWIKELSLEDRVEYLGSVSYQEVRRQYQNSDVFLFTSLRDSFGTVLLEAMSQGLPVITLDHHGAGDIVPDGAGIKVKVINPSETVNAVAQAVEYMYTNPDRRLEMGKIAYEFAKTQTWSLKALKMSKYYDEILLNKG